MTRASSQRQTGLAGAATITSRNKLSHPSSTDWAHQNSLQLLTRCRRRRRSLLLLASLPAVGACHCAGDQHDHPVPLAELFPKSTQLCAPDTRSHSADGSLSKVFYSAAFAHHPPPPPVEITYLWSSILIGNQGHCHRTSARLPLDREGKQGPDRKHYTTHNSRIRTPVRRPALLLGVLPRNWRRQIAGLPPLTYVLGAVLLYLAFFRSVLRMRAPVHSPSRSLTQPSCLFPRFVHKGTDCRLSNLRPCSGYSCVESLPRRHRGARLLAQSRHTP